MKRRVVTVSIEVREDENDTGQWREPRPADVQVGMDKERRMIGITTFVFLIAKVMFWLMLSIAPT
jgi:hypothetical protein